MTYQPPQPVPPPPEPFKAPVQQEPGLPYHRLIRGIPKYRWWKPLVFAVLALVFGFTLTVILTQVAMIPIMMGGNIEDILEFQTRITALDTQDPYAIGVAFASLTVWIPAIMLAAWATGWKPVGRLWSVEFRIRWKLMMVTAGWAVVAFVATQLLAIVIELLVQSEPAEMAGGIEGFQWKLALASLGLAFLLVPFQAAAEELMFRGALMQVLGAWIKNPVIPILLPSLMFALAHVYDPWGMAQVGLMGIACAWLTWRTGGLEAAISLHVVNNLAVFTILSTGITGATHQAEDTGVGYLGVIIEVVMLVIYCFMVVRVFDRSHRPVHEIAAA